MIPRIIHYCWFGGNPLPEKVKACIKSWEKFCPDFEIKQWNESNYDVNKNQYMKQAYELKKWGFVPDYARLDIVYSNGGIYLDTDVELVKSLDELLSLDGFCGLEQESSFVNFGMGFGAEKGNVTIKKIMNDYNDRLFVKENGDIDTTPSPQINTPVLNELGFKPSNSITICDKLTVFPSEYFCPQSFLTGETKLTSNTISIHHYDATWFSDIDKYSYNLKKKFIRVLPAKFAGRLAHFIAQCKFNGFFSAVNKTVKKIPHRM